MFANPAEAYPPNCNPVRFGSVVASTCQNGAIVSGLSWSSSSMTTTTTPGATSELSMPPGTSITTVGTTVVSAGPGGSVLTMVPKLQRS
ncbi:hypothetical protein CH35J_005404 [Colletotrichum higginsianum]|uniref:Uncharacterized protein n=1 Tax=Colletotrichum higginsianum TaxID=80884 RepID=A0A4T0W420_9PEZI|nr:hypothetical protein CH35J_005404 [Colletotrichum higginsianum]